jgi:hypothetical protein
MKKLIVIALAVLLTACASAPQIAAPNKIAAPRPIEGNTGKYMSPYTADGTVAPWVEKGRNASAGASIGGFLGAQAGQKLAGSIPFVGGFLGQAVGETAGRAVALSMVGGEAFIKSSSDLSFDRAEDLAVYMYATNSSHKDFAEVLSLTQKIYPELQQGYYQALVKASAQR